MTQAPKMMRARKKTPRPLGRDRIQLLLEQLESRLPPGDVLLGGLLTATWMAPRIAVLEPHQSLAARGLEPLALRTQGHASVWLASPTRDPHAALAFTAAIVGPQPEGSPNADAVLPALDAAKRATGDHGGSKQDSTTGLGRAAAADRAWLGIDAALDDLLADPFQNLSHSKPTARPAKGAATEDSSTPRPGTESSAEIGAPASSASEHTQDLSPRSYESSEGLAPRAHGLISVPRPGDNVSVWDLSGGGGPGPHSKDMPQCPDLNGSAGLSATEGTPFSGRVAEFDSDCPPFTATITWGDGSQPAPGTVVPDGTVGYVVTGSHTYAEERSYTNFSVTITDSGNPQNIVTLTGTASVSDAPILASGAGTINASEGSSTGNVVVATFTDSGGLGIESVTNDYSASINWGDGSPNTAGMIAYDSGSGVFTVTSGSSGHTYTEEGTFTITTTITHDSAPPVQATTTADVSDPSATASPGAAINATEGSSTGSIVVATFTDPAGLGVETPAIDYSASIDWGDGTPAGGGSISYAGGTFSVTASHTYAEEGSYPVTVTISHDDSSDQTVSLTANITDPPVSASSASTINATEGASTGTVTVANFTDPAGAESLSDYTASITWGDTSTPDSGTIVADGGSSFHVTGTHTYADEGTGSYTITTTITHDNTTGQTATTTANVANPAVSATGLSLRAIVGVAFNDTVATFTDPAGPESTTDYSASITWGDGGTTPSAQISLSGTTFSVKSSYTYTQIGPFSVQVTINHESAATATANSTMTVTSPGSPVVNGVPVSATEGVPFNGRVATITDAVPGTSYNATIIWGDGHNSQGTVTQVDTNHFDVSPTNPYTYTEEGSYNISVNVTRQPDGAMASGSSTATVADGQVTATGMPISAIEGQMFNGAIANFTDQGGQEPGVTFTITINWGDGTSPDTTTGAVSGATITGSHRYTEEGSYLVKLTVTDDGSKTTSTTTTATVNDAQLAAGGIPISATALQLFVAPIATFSDPGGLEPSNNYTIMVDWGDMTSADTVVGSVAGTTVYGAHRYAAANVYTVTITISDERGSSVTVTTTATVTASLLPLPVPPDDGTCGCGQTDDKVDRANGLRGSSNAGRGYSNYPIRYFDGTAKTGWEDLRSSGFGTSWGYSRAWSNSPGNASGLNGLGTVQSQLPFLLQSSTGGTIVVVTNGVNARYFDLVGSTYTPRFSLQETLTHDVSGQTFTLTDTLGRSLRFFDFSTSRPVNQRGQLDQFTDAEGNPPTRVIRDPQGGNPTEVRTNVSGGVPTTESYVYSYVTSGPNRGLLAGVLLRRQVNGGPWSTIRQSTYSFYSGEAYGNIGDLKMAVIKDGSGTILDSNYYRYYTGESTGYAHALKYVFNTQSFSRLVAAVPNFSSATDDQIAPYADNYFEYDAQHRVTREVAQGAGSSTSGGLGTFLDQYFPPSSNPDGPNNWKYKTVETLPDLSTNTLYANFAGQVILDIFQSGSQQRFEGYQYDSQERLVLFAHPSAISGYSEAQPGLFTLNPDAGFVELTNYGANTTASDTQAGDVQGYVKQTLVQRGGNSNSTVLLTSRDYIQRTFTSSGQTVKIYVVAHSLVYPQGTMGDPGRKTSYDYTWFTGTGQMQSMTVTRPIVTALNMPNPGDPEQNGPGTPDVETTFYDSYGRPIWHKDADNFINYTAYDQATGAVTKTISDVDYSRLSLAEQTSFNQTGWSQPMGGLHLVAQMEVDNLGRTTKLTAPNGNITYTVYNDPNYSVRTYAGWQPWLNRPTGPTQVTREDRPGSYTETLTMSATPRVSNGRPTGTEAISSVQTLSRTLTSSGGQVTESDAYFALGGLTYTTAFHLGSAGQVQADGSVTGNYWPTSYAYDVRGRQSRVQSPTGTITRTDFDALSRPVATWIGTTDANVVQVSANAYDTTGLTDPSGVGDGNLTRMTQFPGGSAAARVTQNFYDWRDRLVVTKSGVQTSEQDGTHRPLLVRSYDNLNEVTQSQQYDGDGVTVTLVSGQPTLSFPTWNPTPLRAQSASLYDNQGRVYRTQVYSVDQANGTPSTNTLTTNTWFNHRGQVIKTLPPGGAATKTLYDGAGRAYKSYTTDAAGDGSWTDAGTIRSSNNVLSQRQTTFDANGNPILVTTKERFHNETTGGELGTATTAPLARVSYTASYYDLADRTTDQVNVGTYGGAVYTRPMSAPPVSDTLLVTHTDYNIAGWVDTVTDPRGLKSKTLYDNLGRAITTFEAYTDGIPRDINNRETTFTYDGANHMLTYTAILPTTTQQTQYVYGVTGSVINSYDLLARVLYPGQPSTPEQYTYDALGEVLTKTDRIGTVHSYTFDVLGRQTADAVTIQPGSGVDGSVRSLATAYDTGGRPFLYTSYDMSGAILNQVQQTYNGLGQLITEAQFHGGTSPTLQVRYGYSFVLTGPGPNHSRLVNLTYPNNRQVNYNYTAGVDDAVSRLSSLGDNGAGFALESLSYLGLGTVVQRAHPQPGVNVSLTYAKLAYEGTGEAGDQYTGLDRFGRVVDQRWINPSVVYPTNTSFTDRFQYGYDRDGNRLYRANLVAEAQFPALLFDELYHANGAGNGYDNFNQLINFSRGLLNASRDTISFPRHSQSWGLDAVGNWSSFTSDSTPQTRSHNVQNQIATFNGTTVQWYDANGNTTTDETGKHFRYDAWNRLVEADNAAGQPLATYTYDALGRRITEAANAQVRDLYFSSSWQVLEERLGTNVQIQNVWSPVYVDALVERDRDPNGGGTLSERRYVQQDANFNVTALLLSGSVAERYAYDPYGNPTVLSASWATQSPTLHKFVYLHQGGRFDATSGLYNFRNRDLSPTLGRWMQEDPAGFSAGDTDLYGYVHDNPADHVDPMGLGEATGHHIVSIKAFEKEAARLCKEAVEVFAGFFTGPTNPPHGSGKMGEVTHLQYIKELGPLLTKYLNRHKYTPNNPMGGKAALEFAQKVWSGEIGTNKTRAFNTAVQGAVKGGISTVGEKDWKKVAQVGERYILSNKSRFTGVVVAGSILSIVAAADVVLTLGIVLTSTNLREGVKFLNQGDLGPAEARLIGIPESFAPGTNTFTEEIVQLYPTSEGVRKATNFAKFFRKALDDAEETRARLQSIPR